MKACDIRDIPKEEFEFANLGKELHDEKFQTKPIGYFKDAWIRFRKSRAAVTGAVIIILIILYALIVPLVSPFGLSDSDTRYSDMIPKNRFLSNFGIATGKVTRVSNDYKYINLMAIGIGAADGEGKGATWQDATTNEYSPVSAISASYVNQDKVFRDLTVDVYLEKGFQFESVTDDQYNAILAWQEKTGIRVLYPMLDNSSRNQYSPDKQDANIWYKCNPNKQTPIPVKTGMMGSVIELKIEDLESGKEMLEDNYYRVDGEVQYYKNTGEFAKTIRVLSYTWYMYNHDGAEPIHIFGTDSAGYDIAVRLAYGIRLSLVLAFSVSLINFIIGMIYGAIEGYYGGAADMIMERISDILSAVPFIVVATLFQLHLAGKVGPVVSLLFAFVSTGWIGIASRVRTQFYRFKNSEYVSAARTLGAGDARLMFKHIFPNALGTIITSAVLIIPGVIFSESSLSYLGIVNITGDSGTSIGTMLANANSKMVNFPHEMLFPALVISLLEISFNLFGNGLRDAFNPSLRGTEE